MELRHDPLQARLARTVRAVIEGGGDCWPTLAGLDVLRLSVPVDRDGLDLGLTADIMVGIELGRALEALPGYADTVAAAAVLADEEPPSTTVDTLGAALSGSVRLATAGLLAGPPLDLDGQGRLHGTSAVLPAVPWAGAVVRARSAGTPTDDVLVYAPVTGVESLSTLAGAAVRLTFAGANATVLGVKDPAGTASRVRAQARVRQAAFLRGVAEAALVTARDRVNRREQFGRKLIDFQSISHRLAVLTAEMEGVDLLVHEAAWRCDNLVAPGPAPAQALAAAAETATAASRLSIQLHGARGMLAGTAVERAYRLATVESLRLGRPAELWREAGRLRWEGVD